MVTVQLFLLEGLDPLDPSPSGSDLLRPTRPHLSPEGPKAGAELCDETSDPSPEHEESVVDVTKERGRHRDSGGFWLHRKTGSREDCDHTAKGGVEVKTGQEAPEGLTTDHRGGAPRSFAQEVGLHLASSHPMDLGKLFETSDEGLCGPGKLASQLPLPFGSRRIKSHAMPGKEGLDSGVKAYRLQLATQGGKNAVEHPSLLQSPEELWPAVETPTVPRKGIDLRRLRLCQDDDPPSPLDEQGPAGQAAHARSQDEAINFTFH